MLDDQKVARTVLVQVGGVAALGVQRVRGDDRTVDLDAVQQRGEQGDFVGLGAHLDLAEHHAMGVIERGEQVPGGLLVTAGAA
jgi:hypothetical protein